MPAGESDVLGAADELRLLVEQNEVGWAAVRGRGALQPADLVRIAVVIPAQPVGDDVRLGHDVRHAGVVAAPR